MQDIRHKIFIPGKFSDSATQKLINLFITWLTMQYGCRELSNRQVLIYPGDFFKCGPERQWAQGAARLARTIGSSSPKPEFYIPPCRKCLQSSKAVSSALLMQEDSVKASKQKFQENLPEIHRMDLFNQHILLLHPFASTSKITA